MMERYELATERIKEIAESKEYAGVKVEYAPYFEMLSSWCKKLVEVSERIDNNGFADAKAEELAALNKELYQDVLPDRYAFSYANPEYAVKQFGLDMGQLLSFCYVELRSQIETVFEGKKEELLIHLEMFLEVYGYFKTCCEEGGTPKAEEVQEILYWFVHDYVEDMMTQRVKEQVDASYDFAAKIIMESDFSDTAYLYRYGEYVSDSQLKTASYINSLPEKTIAVMADTFTEGYRKGFELAGIDLSKKETVNIRYCLGFERVIRKAIMNFKELGLKPTIYRAASNIFSKRGVLKIGYYGGIANKQMDYDHKDDAALFMDQRYINRKKEALKAAYEAYKEQASKHAGPACMEIFGEAQFEPVNKPEAVNMTEKQQQLAASYQIYSTQTVNEYIKGDERSFTIIAFPVPEIGENFEQIFDEIIKINTLDYEQYATIQGKIIDTLDEAYKVVVTGALDNRTHMEIMLRELTDPVKETKFENCVADVNIPVGEVFTSPVLKGTNGVLHVKEVYLDELKYENLEIEFADGMVTKYSCNNFASPEENRKFIKDNVLFHHDTLPIGEFAIGTNTTAYVAAQKYNMFDKLPILIAEKMGPHFAVGDTCYSHSEDNRVYNPDGKEIIAKDNEISQKRNSNPQEAYFGCHTDITIPYNELADVIAVKKDETHVYIIKDGRFVLEGCEALNEPFENLNSAK